MDHKEERIKAITKLYYSNPKVQEAIFKFSQNREVVPRYFETFGKRPDTLQYLSDIMGLVNKGATSFHTSQEIWYDPLKISSEMSKEELDKIRKGWDLLIDIDSPFLDCSKIATKLIISALEHHGLENYGIKFSGNKGFHIIVSHSAFPEEFDGKKTKNMFPEWARTISEYLMDYIKNDYNRMAADILINFEAIEKRMNIKKEQLLEVMCTSCNRPSLKGRIYRLRCNECFLEATKKDMKITKKKIRCLNNKCPGFLEVIEEKDYYYCENCVDPENPKLPLSSDRMPDFFEKVQGVSAEKVAALDLILVSPRHLFRAPYSLHEKTALASVVINKEEIDTFTPKKANPLNVKIIDFLPKNKKEEAIKLVSSALLWKRTQIREEKTERKKYVNNDYSSELKNITEEMFPNSIKILLRGLKDGRKRGLFVLLTFLRCLNFSPDYINKRVREWNQLNKPPLKEGYIKGQIEWHLKQKRKILPPNYDNDAFYKDIGLINKKPNVKNPLVEVIRKISNK